MLTQSVPNIFEARILFLIHKKTNRIIVFFKIKKTGKTRKLNPFWKSDGEASALREYIQSLLAFETEEKSHVEYYN